MELLCGYSQRNADIGEERLIYLERKHISEIVKLKGFYGLYYGGMGSYAPFINLYLNQYLALSTSLIGTLSGLSSLIPLIAQPLWCRAADSVGQKRVLLPILGLAAVSLIAYSLAGGFETAIISASFFAASSCGIVPLLDSMTLQKIRAFKGEIIFSDVRLWGSIGYVIATAAFGWLFLSMDSIRPIFYTYAGSIVLFALMILSDKRLVSETGGDKEAQRSTGGLLALLRPAPTRFLLTACFLNQIATLTGNAFLGIFTTRLGGSYLQVGLMSAVSALVEVPTGMLLRPFAARVGVRVILAAAFALNSLRWFLVSLVHTPAALYITQMIGGIVFIAYYTSAVTLIDIFTPKGYKSSGQSIFWVCTAGLSALVGNPLGGFIFDRLGPSALYQTVALSALAAAVIWIPQVYSRDIVRSEG